MTQIFSRITCALLLTFTLICYSGPASAQDTLRRIYDDEVRLFADHTFWKIFSSDRMYFAPDNTFVQQLNDGWNNITPGTVFTGTWEVADGHLCWTYDQKTADIYQTSSDPYCYEVLTNSPADNYMTTHVETFRLFPVTDDPSVIRSIAFEWNQYAYGNYILEPEFVDTIQENLAQMAEYRRMGHIPGGTIKREEMANEWMQAYYDTAINHIFFVADQMMFFNDKGFYFFTDEERIRQANGNMDQLLATGTRGRWLIKDNIHCWFLSENRSSCEYVVPEGRGLTRPYEGFFGVFYDGFTRVHGEMAVGHLAPDETSAPQLFRHLLTVRP